MAWPYDVPIPREPFRFPNDVASRDLTGDRELSRADRIRMQAQQNAAGLGFPQSGEPGTQTMPPPDPNTPRIGGWMKENMPGLHGLFTGAPAPGSTKVPVGSPAPTNQPAKPLPHPQSEPTPQAEMAPVAAEPLSPNDVAASGIADKRALLDSIFPQRDTSETPEQGQANAFAQKELERTKLLAQLAFAGGLTAAGGGSWESVGAGLAAAGRTYDTGFQRYNKALQNAADQVAKTRDVAYGDELTRGEAAFKMYSDERNAAVEAAHESEKQRYTKGADFFKNTKPGEMATPEEREKYERDYQFFLRTGIFLNDVADQ